MSAEKPDKDLQQDKLVDELIPDPSVLPNVRVHVGFLGRSARDGHARLYLSPDLNEYLEFPAESIRHTAEVSVAARSLPRTAVWIDRDAEIVHVDTHQHRSEDYLGGEIAAAAMARAAVGPLRPGRPVRGQGGALVSVPPQASVCFSCPTEGGEDTCVPATCTLSTSCSTQYLCL